MTIFSSNLTKVTEHQLLTHFGSLQEIDTFSLVSIDLQKKSSGHYTIATDFRINGHLYRHLALTTDMQLIDAWEGGEYDNERPDIYGNWNTVVTAMLNAINPIDRIYEFIDSI